MRRSWIAARWTRHGDVFAIASCRLLQCVISRLLLVLSQVCRTLRASCAPSKIVHGRKESQSRDEIVLGCRGAEALHQLCRHACGIERRLELRLGSPPERGRWNLMAPPSLPAGKGAATDAIRPLQRSRMRGSGAMAGRAYEQHYRAQKAFAARETHRWRRQAPPTPVVRTTEARSVAVQRAGGATAPNATGIASTVKNPAAARASGRLCRSRQFVVDGAQEVVQTRIVKQRVPHANALTTVGGANSNHTHEYTSIRIGFQPERASIKANRMITFDDGRERESIIERDRHRQNCHQECWPCSAGRN